MGVGAGLAPFVPLLNASGQEPTRPRRLLLVFTPDGSPDSDGPENALDWKPQGTETDFRLHAIHTPLEPWKSKMVIPWGLKLSAKGAGEQHAYGMAGLWTAALLHDPQDGADFDGGNGHRTGWGSGPSVDQVVAAAFGPNAPYQRGPTDPNPETPYRTIELGVQCGSPHSVYRMIYKGDSQPLHPETNALNAFNRLFASVVTDPNAVNRKRTEQGAIFGRIKADLDRLRRKTSTEEHPKIEAHLSGLMAMERRLTSMTPMVGCTKPAAPASVRDSNAVFPDQITAMSNLIVSAFACDLTRVASLQISRGFSNVTHSWLGQTTAHHTMSHDATVDRRPELQAIDAWYAGHIANLLTALAGVNEGNGSLLDNTLVVCGRELGTTSHRMQPVPFVLAGGAQGALRTGRFIDVNNEPHAKLLVSICRMMGVDVSSIGNINPDSGPLTKLA
jgi:hypothetical protein